MIRRALLFAPVLVLLVAAGPQEGRSGGVVLFNNGYRYYGEVEDLGEGVSIVSPHGLQGSWYVPKVDIKYFSTNSTQIPAEYLGGTTVRPEDIERSEFVLEYKRLEKEMDKVIGLTKTRVAARERRRGDQLLKEAEYRNVRLQFAVRPPRGWTVEEPSGENYVMFVGPLRMAKIGDPDEQEDGTYQPRIHVVSNPTPKADFAELVSTYKKDLRAYHGDALKSFLDLGTKEFVDQDQWLGSLVIAHGDMLVKSRRFLVRHRKNGRIYLFSLYTDPADDTRNHEIFTYWMNSLSFHTR